MTSPTTDPNSIDFSNAMTALEGLLGQWGLSDLSSTIKQMLIEGDSADVIPLKLRETPAYQQVFASNIARTKAGFAQLSEADFLSTRDTMRRQLSSYLGDNPGNAAIVDSWITNDVSATEATTRLQTYQQQYEQQPQIVKDWWNAHGLTPQDAVRTIADPSVTLADLQTKSTAGTIAGMAAQQTGKLNYLNLDQAMNLAQNGVTEQDASKGFGNIAAREQTDMQLAHNQGRQWTQQNEIDDELLNDGGAEKQRQQLYSTDQGQFKGNANAGANSVASNSAGQY